jgi:uncharacterized protein
MKHLAVYLSLALVAPLGHATEGPSFDCTKAATPIEQAICADSKLGDLDKTLAGLLKATLARDPARRKAILSEQRLWLAQRDRTVRPGAENVSGCLEGIYRTRIGQLQILLSSEPITGSAGICKKIVKIAGVYRARLKQTRDPKTGNTAPSPLDALAETPGRGVIKEKHADEPGHRVTLSKEVIQALQRDHDGPIAYIDHLPDSNFFAVTLCDGTPCLCILSKYFTVEDGRARTADGPKNWDDEKTGCLVARWFGTVDGTQVAFQDDYDGFGPQLTPNLSVAPWVKDHFGPFCTVEFKFAPRFDSPVTANDVWPEGCSIGPCDALRKAALKLVQEVQKNPLATEKF